MVGHYALLVIAVVALGLGLFIVAKPDTMWSLTEWRNRAGGVATGERGPAWEQSNRIVGGIVILTGLCTAFGFWQFEKVVVEERARQERARNLPAPSIGPDLLGPVEER